MSNEEGAEDELPTSFALLELYQFNLVHLIECDISQTATREMDLIEQAALEKLRWILEQYSETPWLLDPSLAILVGPLIEKFKLNIYNGETKRLNRISSLLYHFVKVRGNFMVQFLPNSNQDLVSLMKLFSNPLNYSWESTYILLLWLSLVVTIPFPIHTLNKPTSNESTKIEDIALGYLSASGKERDGAVALLSRYHSRKDSHIEPFLDNCKRLLQDENTNIYLATGILQTLCQIVKTSDPLMLLSNWKILYNFLYLCDHINSTQQGAQLKKFKIKLMGRLALLRLNHGSESLETMDVIVKEILEEIENKDTIVRWSAAKYLARISEKSPTFVPIILVKLLSYFKRERKVEEEMFEFSWHGSCLALAELSRRGLLPSDSVSPVLDSVFLSIHFDRLRQTQSIGTPVRDAAAYVLWSFSRTITSTQAEPFALALARNLVAVGLFDREIQVRRAASAAFQEAVGRLGVLPHGIDVLRKMDFFAVSLRKRAFLDAAPQVAIHDEYRSHLIHHLIGVSLVHYDSEIRILAAQALGKIILLEPSRIRGLVDSQIESISTKDSIKLHGILLSLEALAISTLFLDPSERSVTLHKIFQSVSTIPSTALTTRNSTQILVATLDVIKSSATQNNLNFESESEWWWKIIEIGLSKADQGVQESVAFLMSVISRLVGFEEGELIVSLVTLLSKIDMRSTSQESIVLCLGRIQYGGEAEMKVVLTKLIELSGHDTDGKGKAKLASIEVRRNANISIGLILEQLISSSATPVEDLSISLETIISSLNDYTSDQRGDVGSWVRLASLRTLELLLPILAKEKSGAVTQDWLDRVVAAVLKQTVERLDNVREVAGGLICLLMEIDFGKIRLREPRLFECFSQTKCIREWRNFSWTTERVLPFLQVEEYRIPILEGSVLSFNPHATTSPFLEFAAGLGLDSSPLAYSLTELMEELINFGKTNWSSNKIIVPILGVLGMFLSDGILEEMIQESFGRELLGKVFDLSSRSIGLIKSIPRLLAAAKIIVNLIGIDLRSSSLIQILLNHSIPFIRSQTAELLYEALSQLEEVEELLELLSDTDWTSSTDPLIVDRIVELLKSVTRS